MHNARANLNDHPLVTLRCMAEADMFLPARSSFSGLASLVSPALKIHDAQEDFRLDGIVSKSFVGAVRVITEPLGEWVRVSGDDKKRVVSADLLRKLEARKRPLAVNA